MPLLTRLQKITLAEMRAAGVRGLVIYRSDIIARMGHSPFGAKHEPAQPGPEACRGVRPFH